MTVHPYYYVTSKIYTEAYILVIKDNRKTLMTQHDMSKFAYVTLLMKGDSYVPGCLVLASSLRRVESKADIICMVTPDVSLDARSVLAHPDLFTEVIPVDYITTPAFKLPNASVQKHYGDMNTSLMTKLNCLNLKGKLKDKQKQYEKVCLLDADLLILRCMDNLFNLPAPAGTFHSYWLTGWQDPYPQNMKTGDSVPYTAIQEALKRKHSYVVQTTVLLLPTTKPNGEDIFPDIENYIQKFSADTGDLGLSNLLATMYDTVDDLTVSTYFKNWTHIGQEYTCIPWRDQQDHPYVRHYYHNKPWTMHESDWPDLKPWFDEARRICEKYIDARQFFKFLTPTNSTEHQDNIGIRKSGPTHISKQKYLMNNLLIRLKDVTNN
jgi:alpha-N-acetylglucosamine transferase